MPTSLKLTLAASIAAWLAASIAAWLAAVAVVGWLLADGRSTALDRGHRAAAAFAALAEREVSRTFQATYLTLGAVSDAHQLTPGLRDNDPAFPALMTRRL